MKEIETTKYKQLKTGYTNKIFTTIATKSPRPIVQSIRFDARLFETDSDLTKQYISKLYRNLVHKSYYRPFLTTTTFKYIPR